MKSQPFCSPDPSVSLQEQAALGVLSAEVAWALNHRDALPDKLQGCCEAIVRHLDVAFARIWTLNEKDNVLELQASAGLYTHINGPHGRVPVGQFKIGLIAEERKPHLTNQVVGDPRIADQEWAKREGMVAFAGYPLLVENRLLGVVAMFARHPLTEATLQALAVLSDHIAWSIDRKRAQEHLAHEQARFRFIFDSMPVGAALFRQYPDGRCDRIINDAHLRICGLTREQELTPGIYQKINHPEDAARQAELGRHLNDGRPGQLSMEKRYVRLDGEIVWVEFSFQRQKNADGIVEELTTVVDITERKRAEESLRVSQALYHSFVEQVPAGVFRKDAAGRFVFVNPWFCRLKGTPADQMLGRTAPEITADEAQNSNALWRTDLAAMGGRHHEQIMHTGQPIEVEETYTTPSGQPQYLQAIKSAVFGPDHEIIGSQGILFDITEHKRAEAALLEASALLETLFKSTTDYLYFKDLSSRFVHFSQSMQELAHLTRPEELKGKTDFDFFSEELARPAFEAEQEIIRTGKPVLNLEEKTAHLDGRVGWVLTSKMPWRDKAGNIIGTMGISKDITTRKQAELDLAQAQTQLLAVSHQAGMAEFATGILHNVGNVLNSVNVASSCVVDSLKKSKAANLSKVVALINAHEQDLGAFFTSDPKGKQLPGYLAQLASHLNQEQTAVLAELAGLQKNIEHIKDIVTMQQSFAKVSGGKETLAASDLAEDALRMNASALTRHDIQVIKEFAQVPPVTIQKNKALQILVNLVRNAKQACDEGGRPEKILTLRITHQPGRVGISVRDNGVGISSENLASIFTHGFTTKKDGHGFGLHSAALAAKEMGGALTVQSDGPGLGATFTLELPCQTPEPPQETHKN